MTNSRKSRLATPALMIGTLLCIWIFLILLFTTGLFFAHQPITSWNLVVPSLATIAAAVWIAKKQEQNPMRLFWISILATAIILSLSMAATARVYDNSWDGQDYHQRAIIILADGFNPVYQTMEPQAAYFYKPLNHYPKAPWILGATIYKATGNLEAGKALPLILIVISFCIVFSYLCTFNRLNLAQISILALLGAFNPVSANQFLSFYVDGLVSSTILLSIVLMLWAMKPNANSLVYTALFCTVVIGLNIKFTGTAYLGLLLGALFTFNVVRYWGKVKHLASRLHFWSEPQSQQPFWRSLIALCLAVIFGLIVIGYNPYVVNTIRHTNPFYPIYGGDESFNKDYVMTNQAPQQFEGRSWKYRLFRSIFSESGNIMWDATTQLKIPFTFTEDEYRAFGKPDLRIGGFGLLFSGIVLLANEANWWARYVPHIWLIPMIVLASTWMVKQKLHQAVGSLMAVAMMINIVLISTSYIDANVKISAEIDLALQYMAQTDEKYLVFVGPFVPWEVKLQRYSINYQLVSETDQLPCPQHVQDIIYSPADCQPTETQ